ncbi:MFS transporter [Pyrococcus yayanosii]|uniref:Major facilitator superfamily permease n=1 Tax=Pyrococcus yayanosii (strain CH1 / JCM 16557) TaxID=529709 RepID=F8AH89_PYRYC|nr:MFS transporter [Pyrococcus yayanosii]AEH25321.1 major facilitator superfamily permease [Pyrococcus yayanosii CH1]
MRYSFGKDAWLLVAYSFVAWLGGNIVWFVQPFYFRSLGLGYEEIGVIFSLSTLVQAFALLLTGPIAVRFGYRRVILLAAILFLTARLIQVFYPLFPLLLLSSVLLGFGMALEWPAFMSLLSENAPEESRHYLFSLNSAIATIGAAMGSFMGGLMPNYFGYRGTMLIATLLIPVQGLMVFLVSPVMERKGQGVEFRKETLIKVLKFSLPTTLIGLGAGVTIPYMGLWFRTVFGTGLEEIGTLFAVQQFIMGLGTFLLPMIADRIGSVKTIVTFNGSATALIVVLPFLPSFPLAAAVYIIRTILMNIVNPIWDAFMMKFFRSGERSTALALRSFSWTVTFGVGQYLGGILFDRSLAMPFFITGLLYGLSVFSFWVMFKEEE